MIVGHLELKSGKLSNCGNFPVLWVGWIGTHHYDSIGQRGVHQLVSDGGGLVGNGKMRTLQSLDSFCKLTKHICS